MLISAALLLPFFEIGLCTVLRGFNDDSEGFGDADAQVQYTVKQDYVREENGLFRLIETKIPVTKTLPTTHRSSRTDPVPRRVRSPEMRADKPVKSTSSGLFTRKEKRELPDDFNRSEPIAIPVPKKVRKPDFESDPRPSVTSGFNGKYNTTGCDNNRSMLEEFGNAMHDLHRDIFTI